MVLFHESMTNLNFKCILILKNGLADGVQIICLFSKEDYYVMKKARFLSKKHKNNYSILVMVSTYVRFNTKWMLRPYPVIK